MDDQRVRRGTPPWGPPPWVLEHRRRWPWPSTLLITVFVMAGSTFAAHEQAGERADLGVFAWSSAR
ncbi:hypothetical protein [Streptomyces sp. NPDC058739]|uniref:hypothetical protein n=1 Tax=Streptomyces sp. NPDC058739 TaxID=3346618 RepID=UPI00369A4D3C